MKKRREPMTDHSRMLKPVQTISQDRAISYDSGEKRPEWLDPIGMSQLKLAVEKKAKTVAVHGVEYAITYGIKINLPASGDVRECVMLKRTDGHYVPFAYVSLWRILNFQFEEGKG
jgi:hypothetical protein